MERTKKRRFWLSVAHFLIAGLTDGAAVLTQRVNRTLKADPFEFHLVGGYRFGYQAANQIVSHQIGHSANSRRTVFRR
jgi:hypothetical protein